MQKGLLILFSSIIVACTTTGGMHGDKKIVRIAANLPMTGDLAIYGQYVREASMMALEDLQRIDPSGPEIAVDWQDNAGRPGTAVSIMQKHFLNPPDIYISGVHPQTMAIKEQIEAKGTPHFVWIFDAFINKNSRTNLPSHNNFRTWVNFKIEPQIFLNYVKIHKPKRVAVLYVHLSHYEEEYEQNIIPGLKKMGIQDILVEPHELGHKDFKGIATKIRNFNPDLIIVGAFQDGYVGIIRALRPLGLIVKGKMIASYDMLDAAKIIDKDEIDNIPFTAPSCLTRHNRKEIKEWTERFRRRTGREPLYTDAYAYDAIMIIYDAAKRVKLPASSRQWLEALRTTKLQGVTGPLVFDEDQSLVTPVEMGIYHNGKLLPNNI